MNNYSDLILKAHFDELRFQLNSNNNLDQEFLAEIRNFLASLTDDLSGEKNEKAVELVREIDVRLQGKAANLTSKPMKKAGKRKSAGQKRQSI